MEGKNTFGEWKKQLGLHSIWGKKESRGEIVVNAKPIIVNRKGGLEWYHL